MYTEFGNVFERLHILIPSEQLMTPMKYIGIDCQLPTGDIMTNNDIFNFVQSVDISQSVSGQESTDEDSADVEVEQQPISNKEATNTLNIVIRYFEQCPLAVEDLIPLFTIKKRLNNLALNTSTQTTIKH